MSLPGNRYLGVDVMRGMTLALMIVVNMSISDQLSFAPLLHATWHGFTLTDAVFPTFLFVVGAALGFSLERYQEAGSRALLQRVFKRAALIFLCGLFISNFPFFRIDPHLGVVWQDAGHVRILGVLQRIGLTYAIAALLLNFTGLVGAAIYSLLALVGYALALTTFGDLTLVGNAPLKLDLMLLGANHLYHGEGVPFDPEGLLGTWPSVVNVLAGYAAVRFLRQRPQTWATVLQLMAAGGVLMLTALAWNGVLPINKKLWTSSYVVWTVGLDLCVLAALTALIDVRGARWGASYFAAFGKNTLAIYILSEILNAVLWTFQIGQSSLFMWLYDGVFAVLAPGKTGSLLFALAMMQVCWMVAWEMDRRRIYIRL